MFLPGCIATRHLPLKGLLSGGYNDAQDDRSQVIPIVFRYSLLSDPTHSDPYLRLTLDRISFQFPIEFLFPAAETLVHQRMKTG